MIVAISGPAISSSSKFTLLVKLRRKLSSILTNRTDFRWGFATHPLILFEIVWKRLRYLASNDLLPFLFMLWKLHRLWLTIVLIWERVYEEYTRKFAVLSASGLRLYLVLSLIHVRCSKLFLHSALYKQRNMKNSIWNLSCSFSLTEKAKPTRKPAIFKYSEVRFTNKTFNSWWSYFLSRFSLCSTEIKEENWSFF